MTKINTSRALQIALMIVLPVSVLFLLCFSLLPILTKLILAAILSIILNVFLIHYEYPVFLGSPKISFMDKSTSQPSRLVIYNSDVQKIHACSAATASRKVALVRFFKEKKDHQEITIEEYCEYWGLNYRDTITFLNLI